MRILKEQIKQIESLILKGISQKEIAKKFKVSPPTINYYLNKKKRIKQVIDNFNKKSLEEKRKIYRSKKEYMKIWFKNKYHNDPIFRQKHIDRVKKNRSKK